MNIAIILAGGTGTRMGTKVPKQYIQINDKAIITYCMEAFVCHNMIEKIHIVADDMWHKFIEEQITKYIHTNIKFCGFSKPGITRQLSILNALEGIKPYCSDGDNIIIHDAARPLISEELITECIQGLKECDGVLPVLPMKDTVYYCNGEQIELLNRDKLFAGQAPEAFVFGKYYNANIRLLPDEILKINGSTEPAVLAGMDIKMIEGKEDNFKITTNADLEKFKRILSDKA